jgi:hypothetical protein
VWHTPLGVAFGSWGGGRVGCLRDIFILYEILAQGKIHVLIGTLLG